LQDLEGFDLLSSIITSGNSIESPPFTFNPIPEQLTLAATLSVHPKFTTRAKTSEELLAADEALRFLHNVLRTIGPIQAPFAQAFTCRPPKNRAEHRSYHQLGYSPKKSDTDEESNNVLRSIFAHDKSVFSQVTDIWQIIGWAFNCSVAWPVRWERWRLFLELLLDVLEQDLIQRTDADAELGVRTYTHKCIILDILKSVEGRGGRRRVMRAIMANGIEKSLKEFGEVYKNETKERKTDQRDTKRVKFSIEEDKWGDYDMDEDEDAVVDDLPNSVHEEDEKVDSFNINSLRLRARFFSLVSYSSSLSLATQC
jgi:hypothetical protein